jgi:hypothetical protein
MGPAEVEPNFDDDVTGIVELPPDKKRPKKRKNKGGGGQRGPNRGPGQPRN